MTDVSHEHPLTFLVLGCQRCGTTWLDAALREHPEIYLPPQKQTYFFDRHQDRGLDWYLSQFEGVQPDHAAVGEVATGYCLPGIVPEVARVFKEITVLLIVRNPIDRVYSNYQVRRQEQGWGSFEQAIKEDPDLLARSEYADQLDAILTHWPSERVHVLFQEDLEQDDRSFLFEVCRILGVDASIESSQFGQIRNSAMFPRIRRTAQSLGLRPVLAFLSQGPVGNAMRRMRKKRSGRGYHSMHPQTREQLVEHFRPMNERLAAQTGRDLSHWNQ